MTDLDGNYLPHHIFMSLWTDAGRYDIAGLFFSAGWIASRCSWTDYEVELDGKAELVIESEEPILLHGPISSAIEVVPLIRKVLDDAGIRYSFEAHNERDEIVEMVTEDDLET